MSLPTDHEGQDALAEAGFGQLLEWPIEACVQALADGDQPDVFHLTACLARPAESAPPIIALMERAIAGEVLSDRETTILFRGLHVLGAARHPAACAPLLRMLALPEPVLDDLLGDAITATLPRIMAGVFDGGGDSLFAAIADRGRDEYVRNALLGAATWLTWEGRIELVRLKRLLEAIDQKPLADDGECVWLAWINAIALLGLSDLAPRVEQTLDRRLPENIMTVDDFREDLTAALRAPGDAERFERAHLGYIEDVYRALEPFTWEGDSTEEGWADGGAEADDWAPQAPITNPFRRVGRNDPCPCGSGRKAKKCCLSGAA